MFFKSLLVAASLVAAVSADCSRNYTVVAGDICDGISASQKVSTFQLAVVNNVVNDACTNLAIDQNLCLGWPGQDCTETYVVQKDDTCDSIAEAHGLNSTILFQNNGNINAECSNVYIGEVLCVANTAYSYPETVTVASDDQPSYIASADNYQDLPFCDDI